MSDNKKPSPLQNSSVLLFIGGIILLVGAGILYVQRSGPAKKPQAKKIETQQPKPEPVVAPLLVADRIKPIQEEPVVETPKDTDTSPDTAEKPNKKQPKAPIKKAGTIDARAVNSFINAKFGQVKTCYERRLRSDPTLEGKVDLNINISTTGSVLKVSVNKDSVKDSQMLSCVKRTIKGWKFPKPTGGNVVVAKSFNFKKKN